MHMCIHNIYVRQSRRARTPMRWMVTRMLRMIGAHAATPRPLGRWGLKDDRFLKSDYANVDNCGDWLCHIPRPLTRVDGEGLRLQPYDDGGGSSADRAKTCS